jgi:sortase A
LDRKERFGQGNKSNNPSNFAEDLEKVVQINNQELKELNLESPIEKFENDNDFNTIVESFDIKSSDKLNSDEVPRWATISIPAIDSDWFIRSDTVNAYSSVYHFPNSVYPGENGTSGVMGHHTRYSAPFAEISQLKPGDLVTINDFLTLKKYRYEVVSNGDLKWDYKENPIEFEHEGSPKLILVTCYPPGRMEAAWIVHCKLVSIQPLD